MLTNNDTQYLSNWADERMDQIDATLTSLKSTVDELQADSRAKAYHLLSDLQKKRDAFRDTIKNRICSSEDEWIKLKTNLETKWAAFELDVKTYVDIFVLYK